MKTNRRSFIQKMAAGTAGMGLAGSVAAQSDNAAKPASTNRRLVVRGDDVGHSIVHNIGTFEAIENGIMTWADVMLDSPGTVDALERLKRMPWISIGWHGHMWGAPVLGAAEVPSLVEKGGQFDGRFRTDLRQAEDVVFGEALRELRAQLDRCVTIAGRPPLTGGTNSGNTPWARALAQVTEEYGMVNNFAGRLADNPEVIRERYEKVQAGKAAGEEWADYYDVASEPAPARDADPKWADRKIFMARNGGMATNLFTDNLAEVAENYDPTRTFLDDLEGILEMPEGSTTVTVLHPGYVDYYVYKLGERTNRPRARQWVICRCEDVIAYTDDRVKNWIKENRIELVNHRDAIYGTNEYQSYLKLCGSDLCMI